MVGALPSSSDRSREKNAKTRTRVQENQKDVGVIAFDYFQNALFTTKNRRTHVGVLNAIVLLFY